MNVSISNVWTEAVSKDAIAIFAEVADATGTEWRNGQVVQSKRRWPVWEAGEVSEAAQCIEEWGKIDANRFFKPGW